MCTVFHIRNVCESLNGILRGFQLTWLYVLFCKYFRNIRFDNRVCFNDFKQFNYIMFSTRYVDKRVFCVCYIDYMILNTQHPGVYTVYMVTTNCF